MPRSEYRSDYSPPAPSRRGGTTRVTEYDDTVEIRNSNGRRGLRERDYLRDAYERGSDRDGVMIVRDEVDERSTRSGRRDRDRREVEEEVIISRSGDKRRDRDRPRRSEVIEEEEDIRIRERDRDGSVSERITIEEDIVRPRRRERPVEREEVREEVVYRPRRERPYDREEVIEERIYVPRERPSVVREVQEWRFGPKRRSRSENYESITIRDRERERPREEVREEEIDIRERDRRGPPSRDYHESEITIRERDRERDRDRDRPREEEITIRERERDDRRSDTRDEEIRITERDSRGPEYRDEEIRIREREHESEWRERTKNSDRDDGRSNASESTRREHRDDFQEEITIKRAERDGPGGRMDELVIRRKERSPSPEPLPEPAPSPPPPEPEVIRAPPIHQEIITHHRHIDHGYEPYIPIPVPVSAPPRVRTPSPPSPDTPPPKSTVEEISIRHRDANGRHEDDIVIKQKSREEPRPVIDRRRSLSVDGGTSEEITIRNYNGVRRSEFKPEAETELAVERQRFVGERPRTDSMWTEITKDLVVKEAIERFGYEYEETEWYFYIMEYLRADDVRRLAKASDDIRARRRERIRQIERESQTVRETERFSPRSGWEEERIVEREWYGPRSPRPVILPRPLSPPGPPPRFVERDKIVVIRNER